jgi:hypothetical protein
MSLRQTAIVLALTGVVVSGANAAQKVVEPLVNGRTISTANVVATIEARAQSFGPGACAVEIDVGGRKVGFLAPPHTYSGWITVYTHIGTVNVTASSAAKCSTGVMAQVRFYAKE